MNKNDFITYMSRLRELHDRTRKLEDALEPFVLCVGVGFGYGYERLMLDLLRTEINDKDDWLSFFTGKRDWMRRQTPLLYDEDENLVVVDDWGDVYDFIAAHKHVYIAQEVC